MTRIFLVRHAHSTYHPDELGRPLSAQGMSDVNFVTQRIKREKVDVIISSLTKEQFRQLRGLLLILKNRL